MVIRPTATRWSSITRRSLTRRFRYFFARRRRITLIGSTRNPKLHRLGHPLRPRPITRRPSASMGDWSQPDCRHRGGRLAGQNTISRFADVRDGLSSTIMIGESAGRPKLFRAGGVEVKSVPTHVVNGGGWPRPASDFSVDGSSYDGTTLPGPCARELHQWGGCRRPHPTVRLLRHPGHRRAFAFHPAGANFAMGDGSVRFINENINIREFARLVTRDQHEVVSAR